METAIYGRVSTEEQAMEGFSIRAQVEHLKSLVAAKSWSIYDVYLDEGISGKNITERPAINRMIEDIKAGHVKNVVIYKLDRLTRSVADLVFLIDLFKQYGCAFNSLSESIDTSTASGRMFIKIIGIFAEFERENIGERVRLGKERKAREGYTIATHYLSYGYERGKGERVQTINPKEAAIVQRIYDMYLKENMSLSGIACALNAENIPTKCGSIWNSGTVRAILLNCNNAGYVRYNTEDPARFFEADGKHEAIITEEEFTAAKLLVEKNKGVSPTRKPVDENYFAGLLYCGICGRKYVTQTTVKNRNGEKKQSLGFKCLGGMVNACNAKNLTAQKFEKTLIEYFQNLDIAPDVDREAQTEQSKKTAAARIEALQARLTVLDAKEKEILDSYIEDNASLTEYRGVKAQLDAERGRITAEIENLTPEKNIPHKGNMTKEEITLCFNAEWQGYTGKEKRQFLVNHISKIVVVSEPMPGTTRGNYKIIDVVFNAYST